MRWPRRLPFFLLVACSLPASAAAQMAADQVLLDRYQPTPFSDRVLRLDGPAVLPAVQYRVGLDLDYAYRPLVLTAAAVPGLRGSDHDLVKHALGGTLLASVGLGHRLEVGLAVPLTVLQTGQSINGAVDPSPAGIGNVRLGLKVHLLEWQGLGLGVAMLAAVPVGVGTLTHDTGWAGEGRLFGGYRRGPLTAGLRGGVLLRPHRSFYDLSLGNELTAAAGVTWQAMRRTTLLVELAGSTAAGSPFTMARQSPIEALVGVRQRVNKTWWTLAAGPGLVNGYGSPVFRVVAALNWANRPPDEDGDGIPDDTDRCPTDPEDRDGFEDADGCPDPDNDKDGVPDVADRCPLDPEDRDGFEDTDGCPDPDNDRDGILDAADKCPGQPETVNDFEDEDGCPDASPPPSDKDKDGILDDTDECPEEPEDKDGFEDADGCPDLDNDKDGIPDVSDKCPLEPETINGLDDDDGCPDKGQSQVRLGKHEIETLQPIYFDTDRSRVRHAFYNTLGQIASLLKAHPEIGRCGVEGHTDDTGPPDWNQKLSALRAASVIEFLADRGVDPTRLVPIGHGEHLPWASNETAEGRARNRRVVFHIEGVNPQEQKKLEQRQEQRRRIRHRRETEEKRKNEETYKTGPSPEGEPKRPPAPKPVPPLPPPRLLPSPAAPSAAGPRGTGAGGTAGTAKTASSSSTATATAAGGRTGASRPAVTPSPAPAAPRPSSAPAVAPRRISPSASVEDEEEEGTPPDKAAQPPTKKSVQFGPRSPARPARKGNPDGGIPPTLRDLLKLPPR